MIISKSKAEKFSTEISNENSTILSDVTKDKGGSGKYLRPHELLCAGFASCLNITTRMILEQKNIEYENVHVEVDLDRNHTDTTNFLYNIDIIANIDEKTKEQIIELAVNCPVRKTLSKKIEFKVI